MHDLLRDDDGNHPPQRISRGLSACIGLAGLAETCHHFLAAGIGGFVENVIRDAELTQIPQQHSRPQQLGAIGTQAHRLRHSGRRFHQALVFAYAQLFVGYEVLQNKQQAAEAFPDVGGHRLLALVKSAHHVADDRQHSCPDCEVEQPFPRQRQDPVSGHHVVQEVQKADQEYAGKGSERRVPASEMICRI